MNNLNQHDNALTQVYYQIMMGFVVILERW